MADPSPDHPRYASLMLRKTLIQGFHDGLVAEAGLFAHGRGEAFDYLIGEKTHEFADVAVRETIRLIRAAANPVFSVNGNVGALASQELLELTKCFPNLKCEVNLYYHTDERAHRIQDRLVSTGIEKVLVSIDDPIVLPGISSHRMYCHGEGIAIADVVIIALEDGDRAKALVEAGKTVVAIDLNPLSRTARVAHVSIVDEVTRTLRYFVSIAGDTPSEVQYDNAEVLRQAERQIRSGA